MFGKVKAVTNLKTSQDDGKVELWFNTTMFSKGTCHQQECVDHLKFHEPQT